MPSPLTVHCPACDATLKLKTRQYIGKRVACPKCRKPFVVADPANADDDFSALGDLDSYEDAVDDELDEEYERPSRRTAASPPAGRRKSGGASGSGRASRSARSAGKSRKASRRQRSHLPLIIGGAVVGLGILVGLGFLVAGMLGGSKANAVIEEFSYLPADSEAVVKLRLSAIMSSPWQDQLAGQQQQWMMARFESESGIDVTRIESVAVGISGINAGALGAGGPGGAMAAMSDPNLKFVVLIRSLTDFPQDKILKGLSVHEHEGETYYTSGSGQVSMYLANARTMLIGREMDIKRAIEQGAAAPSLQQFGFVDLNQHVGLAFVPRDLSFLQNLQVPDVPGFPAVKKAGDTLKTLVGAGFSLNYGADAADVRITAKFGSAADAQQMKTALDELLTQGKNMLPALASAADPQAAKGITVASDVLNTLSVEPSGDTVLIRLSLSRQTAAELQNLGNMQGF